jgi:hypothetical protein
LPENAGYTVILGGENIFLVQKLNYYLYEFWLAGNTGSDGDFANG